MFLPFPDSQFQCEASYYSGPFPFVIYACAYEFSIFFSHLLPQVYFSRCAERKTACLLHLGCLWQQHKHTADFLMVRRHVHEELCPKEKQAGRTPLLSRPIDCWSERQVLEQLGIGQLLLWVNTQGPFSPRCGYLFPVRVKNQLIAQALFQICFTLN